MAFLAPAAPAIAAASTALAVAGTAYNVAEQKKKAREIQQTRDLAAQKIRGNEREAKQAWNEALMKTSVESQGNTAQEQSLAEQKLMESLTEGTRAETEADQPASADAPKVVVTENARQLGDKLEQARQNMIAKSNLQGWQRGNFLTGIDINRASQKIGQLAGFQGGWANAAEGQASAIMQKHKPLGDILSGVGQAGMQGAGGLNSWGTTQQTLTPIATDPTLTQGQTGQQWLNFYNQAV